MKLCAYIAGIILLGNVFIALIPSARAEDKMNNVVQDDSGHKVLYWHDPMVPGQRFDKPGKSPFMDMQLVPKYADDSGMEEMGGKPVISINADTLQKMGVRTEKVSKTSFSQAIRATGIVMENERIRWDMFSQVEGRVTDLKVSAVGDAVKKDQVFYTLYSPELLALQGDYIAALNHNIRDVARAARNRMTLLGVADRVLDTIAKTRKAYNDVPFYVPADGILTRLEIRNGHYLKANDEIGHIQDLSSVWVEASVPEQDIASIGVGDNASLTFTGILETYTAKVDYIYPMINAEIRTAKVRLVVKNTEGKLRPSGYANVEFAGDDKADRLTVSNAAILKDSNGNHVILSMGGGKFQARDVTIGTTSNGRTEILSGLNEGEEVVSSSQFLIDSESNLRESFEKLSGGDHADH